MTQRPSSNWNFPNFSPLSSAILTNYLRVIRFLFTKRRGFTRDEIAGHLGIEPGGTFSSILEALEESDFIRCYRPFDAVPYEKLYRLIDPFCFMWLHWKEKEAIADTKFWLRAIRSDFGRPFRTFRYVTIS